MVCLSQASQWHSVGLTESVFLCILCCSLMVIPPQKRKTTSSGSAVEEKDITKFTDKQNPLLWFLSKNTLNSAKEVIDHTLGLPPDHHTVSVWKKSLFSFFFLCIFPLKASTTHIIQRNELCCYSFTRL